MEKAFAPKSVGKGVSGFCKTAQELIDNVEKVVRGKDPSVREAVVCMLSAGSLLIEDLPGVGKTILALSMAKSVSGEFKRVQMTPDVLPADVTGFYIYNMKSGDFNLVKGPVFSNMLLCDEINRATPRTQSSLMEAMEEGRVTIEGITHELPEPFMMIATQNPYETHGVFPLPEGQLDRFAMNISLGYPDTETEAEIVSFQLFEHPINKLKPIIDCEELKALILKVGSVYVSDSIFKYAVEIVRLTRERAEFRLGASPRGSIWLIKTAQTRALIDGRDFVIPDDIKKGAASVLAHRVVPIGEISTIEERRVIIRELASKVVPPKSP